MLISDFLDSVRQIIIPVMGGDHIRQAAILIASGSNTPDILRMDKLEAESSQLLITVIDRDGFSEKISPGKDDIPERYVWLEMNHNGSGRIIASHSFYLFGFVYNLIENWKERDASIYEKGSFIVPAFGRHRTAYDYFLTQEGRICRGFDRESYVREMASAGFTHLEVNGLGYPMGLESGVGGEAYPMFYTYCPALDQFVYSELNKGLYPHYYLEANFRFMKENARLAVKYGLIPGMLCFEPRSVPEEFFTKYPMLRGARVDHPFRSFKPRYNMTITHPRVREHYAEMLGKIMNEIPELGFINIWTNDSGAGFEHTKSLYVGRNGGAYLIREWKDDEEIASLAGENALRFFRTLRNEGRKHNPDFRVITRMESFYGEHDTIISGLKDNLDIETSSLIQKGWEMPYSHPNYPEQKDINAGSVYQRDFYDDETISIEKLKENGSDTSVYFGYGPHVMFAPLIGIPYPWLTYQRLYQLRRKGVEYLSHMGGSVPPGLAPYNINHHVLRAFQFDYDLDIDHFVNQYALRNAGSKNSENLIAAWKLVEEAILSFPNISSLYSTIGFTWYRLWVRPLVPDIEKIPAGERSYYQNFMCTTPHNPNNVDLSRDVLFRLIDPENAGRMVSQIDSLVWDKIDRAVIVLENGDSGIIHDQKIRIQALRSWLMTQRNIASWINLVYTYMENKNLKEKEKIRRELKNTILKEMANAEDLLNLLDSGVEFMSLTEKGETPLVYGHNIDELLINKLALMTLHMDDEPFIDHNYTARKAGEPINQE
jgi:hypothetical protein